MLGRRIVIVRSFRPAPGLVDARKILLEHELAVAGNQDGVDIGIGQSQPVGNAAQACAVKADAFG